jgi:hypothetical protein
MACTTVPVGSSGLCERTNGALVAIMRAIIPSMFKAQQPWALVGSCASVLQGLPDYQPPDIDLATTMTGAYIMSGCVGRAGDTVRPVSYSVRLPYSSHFGIYQVGGVKVEVMGDLVIRCSDGVIDLSDHWARWTDHVRIVELEGMHIPVVALEWQVVANALLGRQERVDATAAHLLQTGFDEQFTRELLADHRLGARTIESVRKALRLG